MQTISFFPAGRLLTPEERDVLIMSGELSNLLNELSPQVHELWKASPDNKGLLEATSSVTVAGGSLLSPVVSIGNFVVKKSQPYWLRHELISAEAEKALESAGDDQLLHLLQRAKSIDRRIRDRLGTRAS